MGDNGWLWVVIGGYRWLLVVKGGYGWLWVVMGGFGWLWVVMGSFGWVWVVISLQFYYLIIPIFNFTFVTMLVLVNAVHGCTLKELFVLNATLP